MHEKNFVALIFADVIYTNLSDIQKNKLRNMLLFFMIYRHKSHKYGLATTS